MEYIKSERIEWMDEWMNATYIDKNPNNTRTLNKFIAYFYYIQFKQILMLLFLRYALFLLHMALKFAVQQPYPNNKNRC